MTDEGTILTQWYLLRHSPVKHVRKGIYEDANVNAALPPMAEISAVADSLPENALWYVSPLMRTRQTAEALRNKMASPGQVSYINALREQNFGDWQGLTFEGIWQEVRNLPAHNWSLLAAETDPPNGENFQNVRTRAAKFLMGNVGKEPARPRVLVTHAGVIRALIGTMLGLEDNIALSLGVETFAVTRVLHQTGKGMGGAWRIEFLNRKY